MSISKPNHSVTLLITTVAFVIGGNCALAEDISPDIYTRWESIPILKQAIVGGEMRPEFSFRVNKKLEFPRADDIIFFGRKDAQAAIVNANYDHECVLILWGPPKMSIASIKKVWREKDSGRMVIVADLEIHDSDVNNAGDGAVLVIDGKSAPIKLAVGGVDQDIPVEWQKPPIAIDKPEGINFTKAADDAKKLH